MKTLMITTLVVAFATFPIAASPFSAAIAQTAGDGGEGCPSAQAPQPKKKRGPGLGALFGAARRAGLGEALLGDKAHLGDSKGGQVAGAVLGAAMSAGDTGGSPAAMLGALGGAGGLDAPRAAQVAGAATGMVRELAESAAEAKAETCARAAPAR